MLAIGEVDEYFAQAVSGGIGVFDVTLPKAGLGMLYSSDEKDAECRDKGYWRVDLPPVEGGLFLAAVSNVTSFHETEGTVFVLLHLI
jgi:hypothetical protein